MKRRDSSEFEKFDRTMHGLLNVSHGEEIFLFPRGSLDGAAIRRTHLQRIIETLR
jgi:hypothetical protein